MIIPIKPKEWQTASVQLGTQNCRIYTRQRMFGLHFDLYVDDKPIVLGVLCLNNVKLINDPRSNFLGDLYFTDTQGNSDPHYDGLGDRYVLNYVQ